MQERVEERVVATPGGRFHYLGGGPRGASLILVMHGFPDCPLTFVPLLESLTAAGYRVAAPWLRGYRPSIARGPYSVERLAVDAMEIAQALSPSAPVHLVGHDWGAVIAHVAATHAPQSFASVTRLAIPHPVVFLRSLATRPAQLARSWYMLMFQSPGVPEWLCSRRDGAFIDYLWRTWSPDYRLPDALRAGLHQCLLASMPAPLEYYRAAVRPFSLGVRRVRTSLRERVSVPTLHIHGANDGCVGPAATEGQEPLFTGPFAREIWSGIGHFMQVEAPERVSARIARFCAETHPR